MKRVIGKQRGLACQRRILAGQPQLRAPTTTEHQKSNAEDAIALAVYRPRILIFGSTSIFAGTYQHIP
jgi:hypothetical protein